MADEPTTVDKMVPKYQEGDEMTVRTGHVYKRLGGVWKLIRMPDGSDPDPR